MPEHRKHDIEAAVDFLMVTALLAFALVWGWQQFMSTPPPVSELRYPVRGIDISAHNGMMNLRAASEDGIEFVFIKASEGTDFCDRNFRINYDKARQAGLKVGAYHFFRFDSDGIDQARHFLKVIGGRHLDLGVAIDVESQGNPKNVDPDTIQQRLVDMVEYLNMRGHRVLLYTNRDGYFDFLTEALRGQPLWICSFNRIPINTEWYFWQYDHHGSVKGIPGEVDLNAFCGSRKDWEHYLRNGTL